MDRQDQRVAAHGTAIQSARDTTINQGVGPEEIKAIIEGLDSQLPRMAAIASGIVDERLSLFREEVVKRFDADASARNQAFSDPDFIEALKSAQLGFIRTPQADAHSTLIDLIAERSRQESGRRLSFIINEAIEITAKLTRSELSELALCFFIKRVKASGFNNLAELGAFLSPVLESVVDDVEVGNKSYDYLVSQRCATISLATASIPDILRRAYGSLLMKGQPINVYKEMFGSVECLDTLLTSNTFDGSGVRPVLGDLDEFSAFAKSIGVSNDDAKQIWEKGASMMASNDEVVSSLKPHCLYLPDIIEKWENSSIKSLDLTAVGLTIGHARASQVEQFAHADLKIWAG